MANDFAGEAWAVESGEALFVRMAEARAELQALNEEIDQTACWIAENRAEYGMGAQSMGWDGSEWCRLWDQENGDTRDLLARLEAQAADLRALLASPAPPAPQVDLGEIVF